MTPFKASETTLFFNTRDELGRVGLERVVNFGLANFFELFAPIVDWWALYDNNRDTELIADKELTQDKIKLENIKESCRSKKK